jgi:hypothetical protein
MLRSVHQQGSRSLGDGRPGQSEIVFLMKGLTPTRIIPIISIQKMANDFEHLHKW